MKRLTPRLLILTVLLGFLMILAMPPPARAEWACDLDANMANQACANQYAQCLANGYSPSACRQEYELCLIYAQITREDCEWASGESPQPWPVIDQHLSWCLEGCMECDQITNFFDRFNCHNSCSDFCFDTYPKP